MRHSIRGRLILAFVALAIGPLLVVGIIMAWQSFTTLQQQALILQQEAATRVASQVTAFFQELENELRFTVQTQRLGQLDQDSQRSVLSNLLAYQSAFDEFHLLDSQGQEQVGVYRIGRGSTAVGDRSQADEFVIPKTTEQVYYGPIRYDPSTNEPLMTIAIPMINLHTGSVDGVLVSVARIKKVWDLIAGIQVSQGQSVYIVDAEGKVVAHRNPSVVLRGTTFTVPQQSGIQPGLSGERVVLAFDTIGLGQQQLNIVAEQTVSEALALAYNTILISAVLVVVALAFAIALGLATVRQIVQPIQTMAAAAQTISTGDLSQQIQITRQDELGVLANAFNSMTTQLRSLIGSLEQRVADRTQALEQRSAYLEASAKVGRSANSILDANELIRQVVELIRDRFGFYYVGLFEVDPTGEWAVLRAGTGEAGQAMLARGHQLKTGGESMVGWSIANAEARITQVAEDDATRLATPELPDTRSEAALPLRSAGKVIGALTVQSDRAEAFDEDTITVLQTMADQVAIALANADLFTQTQTARNEAEMSKEKAESASQALTEKMWQTTGQAQLGDKMRGEQTLSQLANSVVQQLCHYLQAEIGALYLADDRHLNLVGTYAYGTKESSEHFEFGEGLVGQAAMEKKPILLTQVPHDLFVIRTGFGEVVPRNVMAFPFVHEDRVLGVIEMGTLAEFSPPQVEFLQTALANIGIAFNTAQARARINELLTETQQQAEELQAQSEELRVANEELQTQTDNLRRSEMALREKQGELEEANAELEAKAADLQEKQAALDRQNRDLTVAQAELKEKAEELALASKYKSEFLANMSHELRTPLNSLLILAGMLQQNEEGNLTADQVESLEVIHNSGRDLLELINEILDLSKIEAGRMKFDLEPVALDEVARVMEAQFAHVAEEKGLVFEVSLADDLPESIETDRQRVQQILKNLLSNAFKFTEAGSVNLQIHRPAALPDRFAAESGFAPERLVALSVIDTGIGIAPEEQKSVFEAFQQVEGGTSRKYGGTGLGLSISRELSFRLGGHITLQSERGKGSTFTLYLPDAYVPQEREVAEQMAKTSGSHRPAASWPSITPRPPAEEPPAPAPIPDDRDDLENGAKILLVIEDDANFARVVYDFAHKKGFKCLVAGDGKTGLTLARTYRPHAIVLDLHLPGMNGWEVLAAVKDSPDTRHIPVHIMSVDDETLDAYKRGAIGFLSKPIDPQDLEDAFQRIESFLEREIKTLLLVEDEANLRRSIKKLLSGSDVKITEAGTGQAALDLLRGGHFDCMILDLSLPDISGFDVLNRMDEEETISKCPVIVYTGRDLTPEENLELMKYADSVIVKGVKSPERLLDETALFLHRVVADLPQDKQQTIRRLHDQETILADKRILIVDDDARNAFALSKLLADKGVKVPIARDGQQALDFLAENPDVDLILMDVMMPVMDGYETMRRIRAQQQFKTLPILALTAKAMTGDREKCLAAGANDYLPKPVDAERLLSMLRVWLYQ